MSPERETLRHFTTEIVGIKPNPGQDRFITLVDENLEQLRIVVVRKGRRVGMTACAGLLAAWAGTVLAPRFREHVMPGEDFVITLVATSKDQAGVLLGFVRRFLRASSMLEEQILSDTTSSITLTSGCIIEAVPCSARANRGRANGLAVLDEAAHFVDSFGNTSLPALLDALTPPLAQLGLLDFLWPSQRLSTQLGRSTNSKSRPPQDASAKWPRCTYRRSRHGHTHSRG